MTIEVSTVREGDVLEGDLWPEPIVVIAVKLIGDLIQIESRGVGTRRAYSDLLPRQELEQRVHVTRPTGARFSGDPVKFRLGIEALRIRLAYEFDPHFAVSVSQIDALPHQLEAVYHYMLPRARIRFLLADDPGAGKTIMAGLLLKELKLRGLAERVLIVVPANLTDQWRREMKDRFGEVFQVVRRTTIDDLYGRNVWTENSQCITSIDFAKREEVLPTLQEPRWDLVIVDEAHKMAAYVYGEDVKRTGRYRLGDLLSERGDHLVLLTATPHKGDPENFRLLMRLLDKEMFDSAQGFNLALGNKQMPLFIRRIKEEMVDFSGHRLFLDRFVTTSTYHLSPAERELYEAVTDYVEEQSERAAEKGERGRLLGFTLALLQRRLASSSRAIRRSLERRFKRLSTLQDHMEELQQQGVEIPEDFEDLPEEERAEIESRLEKFTVAENREELQWECRQLERLIDLAKRVEKAEEETKITRLKELLTDQKIFGTTTKLLIFTEHKDTLDYLVEKLTRWGFKVTQIHGQMKLGDPESPRTRLQAEKDFRDAEGAQIMVATEAAGEGINLHYSCWTMVNYDLPWNPNRLEQRMGRIHRYGQQRDVIIFNLVAEDTREGDVMRRLLDKITEIRRALGTDRVYDVISEVIPGARLDQLFRDALSKQKTWENLLDYVDKNFSVEKVRSALEEATRLGLATQHIDLASLQAEEIRAKEQRLMPEYVEKFLREAFENLGGRIEKRQDGLLRIERVPYDLRQVSPEFKRRFGPVEKEYKKLSFQKEQLKRYPDAELFGPGQPLFESVVERIVTIYDSDVRSGAAFFDPDRKEESVVAFFRVPVRDRRGRVAGDRLVALEVPKGKPPERTNPSLLIDCKPVDSWKPDSGNLGLVSDAPLLEWGYKEVFRPYLEELQNRRTRDLSLARRHVEISLNSLIAESQRKIMKYRKQQERGQDMAIATASEENRKRELEERLQRRLKEIGLEKNLSLSRPEFVGMALLLPMLHQPRTAEMVRDEEVEAAAMEFVMKWEAKQGRKPTDVSKENLGFDIRSAGPGDQIRCIEVKGRASEGGVWLTPNEWHMAGRFNEDYWLYVVFHAKSSPDLREVQDPFHSLPVVEEREVVRYIVSQDSLEKALPTILRRQS